MNKKTTLLTLLMLPFLMANSPMPYPHEVEYEDISFTLSTSPANNWTLNVQNTGDYHFWNLAHSGGHNTHHFAFYGDGENDLLFYYQVTADDVLFTTQTVAPGQSASYTIVPNDQKLNISSVKKVTVDSFNIIDTGVTYSEPKVAEIGHSSYYTYRIDTKIKNLKDYYYAIAVDVKYQDKDYSFVMNDDKLQFEAVKELDLNQFSIEKMTFYRSEYNTYKGGSDVLNVIIIGLVILLVSPIIFIIVFSIIKTRKRRKVQK